MHSPYEEKRVIQYSASSILYTYYSFLSRILGSTIPTVICRHWKGRGRKGRTH